MSMQRGWINSTVLLLAMRFRLFRISSFSISKLFSALTFADESVVVPRRLPCFLRESRTALLALGSASVVLAAAEKLIGIVWIGDVAEVGVSVADAAPSDADVFHRI